MNISTSPQLSAAARPKKAAKPKADAPAYTPPEAGKGITEDDLKWFTKGNKVTALYDAGVTPKIKDDEIFKQVRMAIDTARHSLQLEMFGFGQVDIANALVDAKDRGVNVQVVLDPVNPELGWEDEKADCAKILEKGGVPVLWYPVHPGGEGEDGKTKFPQINHVKMLIKDGEEAIIGGMNWGSHSPLNHDVDVHVKGPIVDKMEALFGKDFLKSGGRKEDLIPIEKNAVAGDTPVSLMTTSDDPKDRSIKAALHRAIRGAKESIDIEQFVFTDWGIQAALKDAEIRGVEVRVILSPFEIEGKRLNDATADKLEAAGVEVKWHNTDPKTGGKLHAKLGIFDGQEVILGSANWSGSGLTWNREANVDIVDAKVAGDFTKMFENDWKNAAEKPIYR